VTINLIKNEEKGSCHTGTCTLFYLGCLIIIQDVYHFTKQEYLHAIKLIQQDMLRQWEA
jgi:hypothetical protein